MNYKKQILVIAIIALVIGLLSFGALNYPFLGRFLGGYEIFSFFSSFAILFALIPLYFSKESIYLAWRKIADGFVLLFIGTLLLCVACELILSYLPTLWLDTNFWWNTANLLERVVTVAVYVALISIPVFVVVSYIVIGIRTWQLRYIRQ